MAHLSRYAVPVDIRPARATVFSTEPGGKGVSVRISPPKGISETKFPPFEVAAVEIFTTGTPFTREMDRECSFLPRGFLKWVDEQGILLPDLEVVEVQDFELDLGWLGRHTVPADPEKKRKPELRASDPTQLSEALRAFGKQLREKAAAAQRARAQEKAAERAAESERVRLQEDVLRTTRAQKAAIQRSKERERRQAFEENPEQARQILTEGGMLAALREVYDLDRALSRQTLGKLSGLFQFPVSQEDIERLAEKCLGG